MIETSVNMDSSAQPSSPVLFEIGTWSTKGLREQNQDTASAFSIACGDVYLVADGMGGHRGGAQASAQVADGYKHALQAMSAEEYIVDALQRATACVSRRLSGQALEVEEGARLPGSTVVLAVVSQMADAMAYTVGHIGDSRAYLWRAGFLRQLTKDHSVVQRLLDANIVSPEDAPNHPQAHVLTRALVPHEEVEMDILALQPLQNGDVLLLCSDGFWGSVTIEAVEQLVKPEKPIQATAEALVQMALEAGSTDNVTVQMIRFYHRSESQSGPRSRGSHRLNSWFWVSCCVLLVVALVSAIVVLVHLQHPHAALPRASEHEQVSTTSEDAAKVSHRRFQ